MSLRPLIEMSCFICSIPARYFYCQHPDTTNSLQTYRLSETSYNSQVTDLKEESVHRPRHGATARVFVQINEIVTSTPRMHDRDEYVVIFHPFFLRLLLLIPLQCALLSRVYFRVKPGAVCV